VNVSPGKTQVRFADAATAFRLVYHALNSALLAGKEEWRLRSVPPSDSTVAEPETGYVDLLPGGSPVGVPHPSLATAQPPPPAEAARRDPEMVPVGRPILASGPAIIDQHLDASAIARSPPPKDRRRGCCSRPRPSRDAGGR
jgi:hypothetical protein